MLGVVEHVYHPTWSLGRNVERLLGAVPGAVDLARCTFLSCALFALGVVVYSAFDIEMLRHPLEAAKLGTLIAVFLGVYVGVFFRHCNRDN